MKIGHVSLSYRPVFGGQDTYIENLKKIFSAQGHKNTVYQSLSFRHEIDHEDVHVVRTLPVIGRFIKNFNWYYFNFFLRLVFTRLLAKEELLIVHYAIHQWAVRWHPNVILLSHGIEWHRPHDQWDDALRSRNAIKTFQSRQVVANDTEYLRHCGLLIEPGTKFFEEVAPGHWFIPNCVDTSHFRPVPALPEIATNKPILVPRNIYFHRGVHLAIDAFAELVRGGNIENNLLIVGKVVDQAYYQGLLKKIEDYGIKGRVSFRGHAKWEEMPALYSSAVCTLIPTIDCEGTSLSALESMACRTPVLATNVGGLKDLPCLLAPPEALPYAEALANLLANRERFAAEQHAIVNARFNLQNWARAWLAAIKRKRA